MLSLFDKNQAKVVEAFNSASGCTDDLLNIDSPCFGQEVGWICPAGLRLGWVGLSCAGATFLGLGFSIDGGMISSCICDRWDDFNFGIVAFPFLVEGVPRAPS